MATGTPTPGAATSTQLPDWLKDAAAVPLFEVAPTAITPGSAAG